MWNFVKLLLWGYLGISFVFYLYDNSLFSDREYNNMFFLLLFLKIDDLEDFLKEKLK